MDITTYVDGLRRDLASAARAIGPEAAAAADRMLLTLDAALRLTVMEVLSQAAAEITAELPAGVVEVRLHGRDPQLVVDVPSTPEQPPPLPPTSPAASEGEEDDDGSIARVTLRIPESVKARTEEMASRNGYSLNAWIVTLLRTATTGRPPDTDVELDLSSIPFFGDGSGGRRPGNRRMSGWV
jgi:hypothetical protein